MTAAPRASPLGSPATTKTCRWRRAVGARAQRDGNNGCGDGNKKADDHDGATAKAKDESATFVPASFPLCPLRPVLPPPFCPSGTACEAAFKNVQDAEICTVTDMLQWVAAAAAAAVDVV